MRELRSASIGTVLVLASALAGAQSLWSPDSQGLLSSPPRLRPGDVVTVEVDAATTFSFRSIQSDAKSLSLELSGGQGGGLFSFLPSGSSSGDRSVQGGEELALQTSLGALVQEVNASGAALVQGVRRVSLGGREESVTLSGWLSPADLGADRRVRFERLADSRLVFRSLLQSAGPTLAPGDLVTPPRPPAAAAAAPSGAPAQQPAPGQTPTASAAVPTADLQLSEAKRRELLLQYLNRVVDILFQ